MEKIVTIDKGENAHLSTIFQLHELKSALKEGKNNSAPGQDNIAYEMLKNMSNSSLKIILTFFNQIWESDELIEIWKTALIIPICKDTSKSNELDSYRPISLTPVICKSLERLVTKD